jgi:hypothetical protein
LLKLSSWNGDEHDANFYTRINGWTTPHYGKDHFFSYDKISVPVSALKTGNNSFTFCSFTTHHGIEIMWPGPSILVRYGSAPSGNAPSITQQPSDKTAQIGSSVSFSVSATGTPPLNYQWRRNGTNISGATGASYTISSVASSDDGDQFSCRVSNSYGSVISRAATLTVSSSGVAPSITSHPSDVTVQAGGSATFSVSATGTTPLNYQWRRNGSNISGATSASYIVSSTSSDDNGDTFLCVVSNAYGTVTSNPATLTVTTTSPPPPPSGDNPVSNPGFEDGSAGWGFFTSGSGDFSVASPGHDSANAARIRLATGGINIQFFQSGLYLEPNTQYQLSFSAYCTSGNDLKVSLVQHEAPYANYGLARESVNLTATWNTYTLQFTTPAFGGAVNDGRLMFWLADDGAAGDEYWIDNVIVTSGSVPPPPSSNVLVNPGFENGQTGWGFFTNGSGNFSVTGPGDGSANAARISLATGGTNIQFFQSGVPLESNTEYQLTFSAYCTTGHDLKLTLVQHEAPYANYGLAREAVNLSGGWNTYTIQFTTPNLGGPVDYGRLMFWLADDGAAGDVYWIDNVILSSGGGTVVPPPSTSVLDNPNFESGTAPWRLFTNGSGNYTVTGPGENSANAARISLATGGSNIQFFQAGVPLEPNTQYQLSFSAYCNTGHDLKVTLVQHEAPYANYGLARETVNLSNSWDTHTIQFTTPSFGSSVDDGRLMFWLADDGAAGDVYWIDNVNLSVSN